jgi:hypothetical protein
MFKLDESLGRRRVLRGMLGGTAITVGLPLLDVFLNANGDALADGQEMPLCFVSWFVGLGLNHGRWEPKKLGAGYDMNTETACLQEMRHKINVYSGLRAILDGNANQVHFTGSQTNLTGSASKDNIQPSLDVLIADAIGSATRFRSIEASCDGTGYSLSRRSAQVTNPSEVSPVALYTRIFGPEFVDPNAAAFMPDPRIMVRRSALSAISDSRQNLAQKLGSADRARLDQYFTSLRELEQRLEVQLQKPAPMKSCTKATDPGEVTVNTDIKNALSNNKIFASLIAHALVCGQTQVANIAFSQGVSSIRDSGSPTSMHTQSHEDPIDPATGIQTKLSELQMECLTGYRDLIVTMDGIKEGDKTLLDRSIVLFSSDVGNAAVHGLEDMPFFTAGGANGRLKTGIHVSASGDTVARVGYTIQHAMGLSPGSWGTESNRTNKVFSEVLA